MCFTAPLWHSWLRHVTCASQSRQWGLCSQAFRILQKPLHCPIVSVQCNMHSAYYLKNIFSFISTYSKPSSHHYVLAACFNVSILSQKRGQNTVHTSIASPHPSWNQFAHTASMIALPCFIPPLLPLPLHAQRWTYLLWPASSIAPACAGRLWPLHQCFLKLHCHKAPSGTFATASAGKGSALPAQGGFRTEP